MASMAAPISWQPSTYWDGNDGLWNSFVVQAGAPAQDFRVYPSTAGQELWIPVPAGCTSIDPSDPGYCGFLRGTLGGATNSSGFESNSSSSWEAIGLYTLDAQEAELGYTGNGDYGFDTVTWGNSSTSNTTLQHQVVAGIADPDWWLGLVGLGPKPSNFTNFNKPIPSFMSNLVEQNRIPSLSWAYTAGASYRNKSVASLTLGGYDVNRIAGSGTGLSMSMNADNSRPLQVGVQKILATNTLDNDFNLLPSATYHFIDSTVPHIWLPDESIELFVTAFGLTYDNNTDLFLVNDTIRARLLALNPTITFVLSASTFANSGQTQNIVLPYAAFDLQASYPFYSNATNYFPIRRAANDTQYTIGRAFLQEAYLVADFERQNFTIAQTSFDNLHAEKLVAITRPANTTSNTNPSTSSFTTLSAGAVAGIVVGAVVLIALIAALGVVLRRRKQKRQRLAAEAEKNEAGFSDEEKTQISMHPKGTELSGDSINELPAYRGVEMHQDQINEAPGAESNFHEAPGGYQQVAELEERRIVAEVAGSEGRRYELAGHDVQ